MRGEICSVVTFGTETDVDGEAGVAPLPVIGPSFQDFTMETRGSRVSHFFNTERGCRVLLSALCAVVQPAFFCKGNGIEIVF